MGNPLINMGHVHDIYSTSETVVGYWIDGRPIYRRVWSIGTVSYTATTSLNLAEAPADIGGLVKLWGCAVWGNGDNHLCIPRIWSTSDGDLSLDLNGGWIRLRANQTSAGAVLTNVYVIAEYYKTTD